MKSYKFDGNQIDMYICWEEPSAYDISEAQDRGEEFDPNEFYDFFCSATGECLNLGYPWYADKSLPREEEIREYIYDTNLDHFQRLKQQTDNEEVTQ